MKIAVFAALAACVNLGAAAQACTGCRSSEEHKAVRAIAEDYKVLSVEDWCGGRRIEFDFKGYNAWIVLPPAGTPVAEGRPWTWTMQWRTAFVKRTGAPEMLRRGWHHAAIDTFKHRMDSRGLEVNRAFQRYIVEKLGLKPKAALIGLSWGGFFSVRYTAAYPECVERVYLDAPLLTFHDFMSSVAPDLRAARLGGELAEWSKGPLDGKSWENDPRMPVNMAAAIARAKTPVLLLYGGQDQTVIPGLNSELFIERMKKAGGDIRSGMKDAEGRGRYAYGHHPHGLDIDQQDRLAEFFEESKK
jgi:dienelactone hydrolase